MSARRRREKDSIAAKGSIRPVLFAALALALVLGWPGTAASAQGRALSIRPAAAAATGRPVIVPRGETVDTILSIDRPVVVYGSVSNSILAFGGDVTLAPGSSAAFVLAIQSTVRQAQTSRVTEGIVSIGRGRRTLVTLALSAAISLGMYFVRVSAVAVLFAVLAAGGLLVHRRDEAVSALLRRKHLRILGTGALLALIPAAMALASWLTPALWIAAAAATALYALSGLIGLVFISNALGRSVTKAVGETRPALIPLYGALGVILATDVPLLGLLTLSILWVLAAGLLFSLVVRPHYTRQ